MRAVQGEAGDEMVERAGTFLQEALDAGERVLWARRVRRAALVAGALILGFRFAPALRRALGGRGRR